MKIKKILLAFILGGLLLITGCQSKASLRTEIEGKFTKLSEVYPTENLEELMNKFPDKEIKILHFETRKESDDKLYTKNIVLEIKDKNIIGKVSVYDYSITPEKKLDEYKIIYNQDAKKLEREDGKKLDPQVENVKFLFQMLDVKNNPLSRWNNERVDKIEGNGGYSATYYINNKELFDYLNISNTKDIRIDLRNKERYSKEGDIGTFQLFTPKDESDLLENIVIENKGEK